MRIIIFTIQLIFLSFQLTFSQKTVWNETRNSPVSKIKLDDCFFINSNIGWLINVKDSLGEIYKTTDGGESWRKQFEKKAIFRCVGFTDSLTGWIGTLDSNLLYETKDGGRNWNVSENISKIGISGICGIFIVNKEVIYGCGKYSGPASIIKTTDGGKNWKTIDMKKYATCLVDCYFFNKDSGIVIGGNGSSNYHENRSVVLHTSNGGNTWKISYQSKINEEICWKISMTTKNTGYISIQSFSFSDTISYLKTLNAGASWERKSFNSLSNVYESLGIFFLNDSIGWIGGIRRSDKVLEEGETFQTTDGGKTWIPYYFGFNINRFRKINDSTILAVGKTVYKYNSEN